MTDLGWDELPEAAPELTGALPPLWEPYEGEERPIGADGQWMDSRDLCAWIRERTDHVLVGFSCGKDSISAWHRLREFWPLEGLHPYHLYVSPHLAFEERTLTYYEQHLGTRIMRLPNRSVFRFLNDAVFQTPANLPVIWGALFPDFTYPDIYSLMTDDLGLTEEQPWVAHGVRAADSPMRRMLLKKHGPWRPNERVFYPVHDWYVADVRECLRSTGTKLPVDYRLFGRTFDGLDHRFTHPLRETFPEDYDALTDLYPLIGLDSWRRGGPAPDA